MDDYIVYVLHRYYTIIFKSMFSVASGHILHEQSSRALAQLASVSGETTSPLIHSSSACLGFLGSFDCV